MSKKDLLTVNNKLNQGDQQSIWRLLFADPLEEVILFATPDLPEDEY